MGLWGTRQPVSQPGGDSAPSTRTGAIRLVAAQEPGCGASPRASCPHFAHWGERGGSRGRATLYTAWSHRDPGHGGESQYHVPEGRVETCTKWRSGTPGPEGAQLPADSHRTLQPVSGPSEPETGPRRAPGREWAGPLSRKCLWSWPGARPRGLRGLAALRGGGTEPGSRPRSLVSVRLREGGTL